jgi:hypothetical protein
LRCAIINDNENKDERVENLVNMIGEHERLKELIMPEKVKFLMLI